MKDGLESVNSLVEKKAAEMQQQQQQPPLSPDPPAPEPPGPPAPPAPQDPPAPDPAPDPAPPVPDPIADLLKETGFESLDALRAAAKKPESEDEAKRKDNVYRAGVSKYAVDNEIMTMDEIVRYESIKSANDEDLVFNAFSEDVKEEILEELPEDASEEEILAKIKERFEAEYPINASSERARLRAEKKMKAAADAIRKPLESSFNTAKSRYDDESSVRQAYPSYQKEVTSIVDNSVPNKLAFFSTKEGDREISVDLDIPENVRKDILSTVRKEIVDKPETFLLHKNGKVDDIRSAVNDRVEYLLWKAMGDAGKAKMAEVLIGEGLARAEMGAKESFAAKGAVTPESKNNLTAQQQILQSTRKKT